MMRKLLLMLLYFTLVSSDSDCDDDSKCDNDSDCDDDCSDCIKKPSQDDINETIVVLGALMLGGLFIVCFIVCIFKLGLLCCEHGLVGCTNKLYDELCCYQRKRRKDNIESRYEFSDL